MMIDINTDRRLISDEKIRVKIFADSCKQGWIIFVIAVFYSEFAILLGMPTLMHRKQVLD